MAVPFFFISTVAILTRYTAQAVVLQTPRRESRSGGSYDPNDCGCCGMGISLYLKSKFCHQLRSLECSTCHRVATPSRNSTARPSTPVEFGSLTEPARPLSRTSSSYCLRSWPPSTRPPLEPLLRQLRSATDSFYSKGRTLTRPEHHGTRPRKPASLFSLARATR